jgi:hypothetical protein
MAGSCRGTGFIMGMIANGATHIGVPTDHGIESFRNALWSAYKTGWAPQGLVF